MAGRRRSLMREMSALQEDVNKEKELKEEECKTQEAIKQLENDAGNALRKALIQAELSAEEADLVKGRLSRILYHFKLDFEQIYDYDHESKAWLRWDVVKYSFDKHFEFVEFPEGFLDSMVRELIHQEFTNVFCCSYYGSRVKLYKNFAQLYKWLSEEYVEFIIELIIINFYSGYEVPKNPQNYILHPDQQVW